MESTKPPAKRAGRTVKAAHQRAQTVGGTEAVMKAGELVEARYADGASLSTTARKLLVVFLHKAAGSAGEDRDHCIAKADLRGTHDSNDRLHRALDELQQTLLRVPVKSPNGRDAMLVTPLISQRVDEIADDARAMVWWRFSEPMREIIAGSDYYAELSKQTVLALESKYAISLYEMGALLHRRENPSWRGDLTQFREKFGVPGGKLPRWVDLRRNVIEPAVAEVRHLAVFDVEWQEYRYKGTVIGVEFRFWHKTQADKEAAMKEVASSRVGRRVRRSGAVERVVDPGLQAALDALAAGELPPGARG